VSTTFERSKAKSASDRSKAKNGRVRSLARARPITDTELARLRELHGTGASCRAIAREMDRSPVTVSRHAAALGLSFDRSQVKAATEARVADIAARRAKVSAQFIEITEKMSARMLAELDDTGAECRPWRLRDYSYAIGALFDRHLAQSQFDATGDQDASEVDRWLAAMTGQEPPPSRSDTAETAKCRSVLGALMNDMVERHGPASGDG
jgi:hypothetical protein